MVLIAIFGTMENAIVIMVLYKHKPLHTPTNQILASLALADFLSSLLVAPLHAVQLLDREMLNNCSVDRCRKYLSPILVGASSYIIVFISYDRCLHLRKLQDYRMPKRKLYAMTLLCWSMAIAIPLIRLFDSIEAKKIYSILVIMNAILILLALTLSYVGLLAMLKFHQRATNDNSTTNRRIDNERRAVRTIILILSLYVIMLIPIIIFHGLYTTKNGNRHLLAFSYIIGISLALGNSVVNPLVYCYRTPILKRRIKLMVGIRPDRKISRTVKVNNRTRKTYKSTSE